MAQRADSTLTCSQVNSDSPGARATTVPMAGTLSCNFHDASRQVSWRFGGAGSLQAERFPAVRRARGSEPEGCVSLQVWRGLQTRSRRDREAHEARHRCLAGSDFCAFILRGERGREEGGGGEPKLSSLGGMRQGSRWRIFRRLCHDSL